MSHRTTVPMVDRVLIVVLCRHAQQQLPASDSANALLPIPVSKIREGEREERVSDIEKVLYR